MEHKQRIRHLLTLSLILLALVGCKNQIEQPQTTKTVQLTLVSSQFCEAERNIVPEQALMQITSYHVTATGPKNATAVDIIATTSPIELGQLTIGKWTIHAEARNNAGDILASGDTTKIFSPATTTAQINLETLNGRGSLNVTFSWQDDQVNENAYLSVKLTDQEGTEISIPSSSLLCATGSAELTVNDLAAGSYVLQAKLFSDNTVVSGGTSAVRVIENTPSSGTMLLFIGDLTNEFDITIVNNTTFPVQGTITCSPSPITNGTTPFALAFTPTNLKALGLSAQDLVYQWYCEGEILTTQSTNTLTVSKPLAGTHRYDLVINSAKKGSVGSASILVSIPVV
ncbi:MAG: hypothetical protein WCR02_11525 [Sphaerochaetaceae bacterium]